MQNFMELLAGIDIMATNKREQELIEEELQEKNRDSHDGQSGESQEKDILGSSRYFIQHIQQKSMEDYVFVYFSADEDETFKQCQGHLDCFWIPVRDGDNGGNG